MTSKTIDQVIHFVMVADRDVVARDYQVEAIRVSWL
jgi:hypothetical protein